MISSKSVDGQPSKVEAAKPVTKKIAKFSWSDEESKVKIYVDLAQFKGSITQSMISVTYDEFECNI